MKIDSLAAYEVLRKQDLPDIHSVGWILRHRKTGARVMVLENDDENKVFHITFRTPPKDSTGVAHILEHSVLCGSKNFPLKDPFVELVKGSLNTFLNAMTFPDKTCYPVASCNDQDFQNLIHVYLDAVFYPNIYQREEIFRQEGWHYEMEQPEGPLTYSGVVYNEMKGAFSSPDDVLEREIMNHLFPDTPYGVESGGDPDCIPNLSYEAFLDFHRTYYHPSNAFLYLYGNADMAQKLDFIDLEYLSAFDALEVASDLPLQPAFSEFARVRKEYPVAETDTEEGHTYLSYNVVAGGALDNYLGLAFQVLDYALLSAPGAPLKKTLIEAGIGSDVYGAYEDGIRQPYFSVVAKGADLNQEEEFASLIRRVLEDTVKEGIDRKAVLAGINFLEFRYREADFSSYPKGLMYGLNLLGDWLYSDENPFAQVSLLEVFQKLKDALDKGFYEDLIRRYLLENPHGCLLSLIPKKGLAAKKEQELADRLETYRQSLSQEDREQIVRAARALEAYQEQEDSPEDIARLPMLRREDISPKARGFTTKEDKAGDIPLLVHLVRSNGIGYVDLMFRFEQFSLEQVHTLGLLKSVLGYVDTANYSYGELFNEINAETGGLSCGVETFEDAKDPEHLTVMFSLQGKALYPKLDKLFEMAGEILESSRIEDTKRLYEIVAEVKSRMQASMLASGHGTATLRAASYGSSTAAFQDELAGIGYYRYIEDLEKNFETKKKETVERLRSLMQILFTRAGLMVSYTGEEESLPALKKLVENFAGHLADIGKETGASKTEPIRFAKRGDRGNEGFQTAGQVQFVAQCGNYVKKGLAHTGTLDILKVILSYEYLWMNLRVKGGAYGCMSGFKRNGESYFVSYRDPHLHRTLKVYEGIPDFVRSFEADEHTMTKYIIGTMSGKDVPRTPQMQGAISRNAWFCHVTDEMVQKERDEILSATVEDIRALAPLIEAVLADRQICVVGTEAAIAGAKDVLDHIEGLF